MIVRVIGNYIIVYLKQMFLRYCSSDVLIIACYKSYHGKGKGNENIIVRGQMRLDIIRVIQERIKHWMLISSLWSFPYILIWVRFSFPKQ